MTNALDSAQLRDFEEVHKACKAAENSARLSEVIDEAIQQFGFRWFALVDDGDLYKHRSGCMMLTNYPSSWVDEVISARLYRDDPVHAASIRSPTGLCWERIPEVIAPTRAQLSVLERGRAHGRVRQDGVNSAVATGHRQAAFDVMCKGWISSSIMV